MWQISRIMARAALTVLAFGCGGDAPDESEPAPEAVASGNGSRVEVEFMLDRRDLIPEGIAHDPLDDVFYVGSTYRRLVMRVSRGPGGAWVFNEFASQDDGLWGVVGMRVDPTRRLLWLASSHSTGMPHVNMDAEEDGSAALFAFDLGSGDLVRRVVPPGTAPSFLNDVTIGADGTVYASDSRRDAIYRVGHGDTLEIAFDLGMSANGLDLDPGSGDLYVASGAHVLRVDSGGEVHVVQRDTASASTIDGLYWTPEGLIAVQPFEPGRRLVRIRLSPDRSIVAGEDVLLDAHPALAQPTTAAVVEPWIFLLANSHLQEMSGMWREDPALPSLGALRPPAVLRIPLAGR